MSASTCHRFTYYEARVSLFVPKPGSNLCNDLDCLEERDGARYSTCDGSLGSYVTWESASQQIYYILVHGDKSETGPFGLTLDFQIRNDDCSDADVVPLGPSIITGSTERASKDEVDSCRGVDHVGSGVWYSVEGTGNSITAKVCSEAKLGLSLSIFAGTCGSLTCIFASKYHPLFSLKFKQNMQRNS